MKTSGPKPGIGRAPPGSLGPGHVFGHPGKKLLFMGSEWGQWREWNAKTSLDWHHLEESDHAGLQRLVRDLNTLYRAEKALFEQDFSSEGFQWIDFLRNCWRRRWPPSMRISQSPSSAVTCMSWPHP